MKPLYHARASVRRYGGQLEDYEEIHNFIDSSKMCLGDMRHRALFHSTLGCFLVEKIYGLSLMNSDGKEISTRQIAEDHVKEDLGFLPTPEQWLKNLPLEPWMLGGEVPKLKIKTNQKLED